MRLLSSHKLELQTFPDHNGETPKFAILSHTWSSNADDEVLYVDIQNGTAMTKPGYAKVSSAMKQARESQGRYDYIWIDTCCINRDSSSELSEAINSMFAWYEAADVCLAYISDRAFKSVDELRGSRWFTRGWTLQELIAPRELVFFDQNWTRIGARSFPPIASMVAKRTGVAPEILNGTAKLPSISIAQRMSWCAGRKVTRPEDIAYCLMGIFGVNMPMLYGEGAQNAFHRLQEQIMKDSSDHSIFTWTIPKNVKQAFDYHGLLADSPDAFAETYNVMGYADYEDQIPHQPGSRGLRLDLHLTPVGDGTFYAALNCPFPSAERGYHGYIAIMLKPLAVGLRQFARIRCSELFGLDARHGPAVPVYVRQRAPTEDSEAILPWHFFQPRNLICNAQSFELVDVAHYPLSQSMQHVRPRPLQFNQPWLAASQASAFQIIKKSERLSAVLRFRRNSDHCKLALLFGSVDDLNIGFDVMLGDISSDTKELEKQCRLKPPGTTMLAGTNTVRVDVDIRIEVPCKIYICDITINGSDFSFNVVRPIRQAANNPQELMAGVFDDLATDVRGLATDSRYRPMSVLRRMRQKPSQA